MTTYRERRLARAERLREWADKREARSQADLTQAHRMADAIPFGQPILVGHHSEGRDRRYRDRMHGTMARGVENGRKATEMSRKADSIEAAADRAIYDDDADATERLTERIAGLEAERARIVAYNKSCRKGERDVTMLDERQQAELVSLARIGHGLRPDGSFASYHTSNLSGNVGRLRKRLEQLQAGPRTGQVVNRYAGTCETCGADVAAQAGIARKVGGGDWQVFCTDHS